MNCLKRVQQSFIFANECLQKEREADLSQKTENASLILVSN